MLIQILKLFSVFFFLDLFANGLEYPCSGSCEPTQQTVFKIGHTYMYTYIGTAAIRGNVSNSKIADSSINVTFSSDVEIYVLSPCELVMQMGNIKLERQQLIFNDTESPEFSKDLAKNSLHIHYRNGTIPEICVGNSEPTWVLNIKRGIVSLLQYNWEKENHTAVETDIQGTCDIRYMFSEQDGWNILKKKSNLTSCLHRGGPYAFVKQIIPNQQIYPLHFVKSVRNCKYVLGDTHQPVIVTCKEKHRFVPHESVKNIFVTNFTQELHLDRIILKEMPHLIDSIEKVKLFFQMENSEVAIPVETIEDVINQFNKIHPNLQNSFLESPNVITLLSKATNSELKSALETVEINKWVWRNALMLLKSAGSVGLVASLTEGEGQSCELHEPWLLSLPFYRDPSKEMLKEVKQVFRIPHCKKAAFLGVSGLIYSYCNKIGSCNSEQEVYDLLMILEAPIYDWIQFKESKKLNSGSIKFDYEVNNYSNLLMSLKAIGNAGVSTEYGFKHISDIVQDVELPAQLRIAGIQSYRRMEKIQQNHDSILKLILGDHDPEVQIAAYFHLIQYKYPKLLDNLMWLFQLGRTSEATTYIWNHLSRTHSELPKLSKEVADIFKDNFFRSKYQLHIANYDYKRMNKSFEAFQANIEAERRMYYEKSNPLGAFLNAGLSMFENKTSIVEIGAHFRNIDNIVMKLGTQLLLQKYTPEDASADDLENNILTNDVGVDSKNQFGKKSEAEISMKIFGHEIYFYDVYNMQQLLESFLQDHDEGMAMAVKPSDKVLSLNRKHQCSHQALTNSYYILPSSLGFPFTIHVNSSWQTAVNISNFAQHHAKDSKSNLEFTVIPHVSLNMSGSMYLDIHKMTHGLSLNIETEFLNPIEGSASFQAGKLGELRFGNSESQNTVMNLFTKINSVVAS